MDDLKYVECQNCGTIHYIINEVEAKNLKESGLLLDNFSNRNLECCSSCGSKNKFLVVSENYVNEYSHSDKIPPILFLLKDEEFNTTTTRKES